MKTYINPSPWPVRLTLADGTELQVPAWGMVKLEGKPVRIDPVDAAVTSGAAEKP